MKITDIIRGVLDIVDAAEQPKPKLAVVVKTEPNPAEDDAELVRMRQIAGLIGTGDTEYSNSPEEMTAPIDAVLASGDDVHKSKHPSDMRSDSISMYPNHQHRPGM
jgi:hypothetical protein